MPLLTTEGYRDELLSAVARASRRIDLLSPYITVSAIQHVLAGLSSDIRDVRILARWQASDLVFGASDVTVYDYLRGSGFRFFVNQTLHAKVALIDEQHLFVGSANLTGSGLQVNAAGNWEAGTYLEPSEADIQLINDLFSVSTEVTDSLYNEIRSYIISVRATTRSPEIFFPSLVTQKLEQSKTGLWVRDLFWCHDPLELSALSENALHDRALLEIQERVTGNMPPQTLSNRFLRTRCCCWLTSRLASADRQTLHFGELSSHLHTSLLEDPKPYRKDVKTLVANLLRWASTIAPEKFAVESLGHSQQIHLVRPLIESASSRADHDWLSRLVRLRRDDAGEYWNSTTAFGSPHKPLFLLALLETIARGGVNLNKLYLDDGLETAFFRLWHGLYSPNRRTNAALPFYHLASDGLWTLRHSNGQELNAMQARSLPAEERLQVYAEVDTHLAALLLDNEFRGNLREALFRTYFDQSSIDLLVSVHSRGQGA